MSNHHHLIFVPLTFPFNQRSCRRLVLRLKICVARVSSKKDAPQRHGGRRDRISFFFLSEFCVLSVSAVNSPNSFHLRFLALRAAGLLFVVASTSGLNHDLDRFPFVHRAVAVRHIVEGHHRSNTRNFNESTSCPFSPTLDLQRSSAEIAAFHLHVTALNP